MDKNDSYFDNITGNDQNISAGQGNNGPGNNGQIYNQQTNSSQVYNDRMNNHQAYHPVYGYPISPRPVQPPKGERGSGKGLFLGGLITGIAGALLIFAICYLGLYIQKLMETSQRSDDQFQFGKDSAINESVVGKLQNLETTIDKYFYLWDVTDVELQNGLYRGMLEALGDPYSEYYSAEELNLLMEQTEGVYYGIGAYIQLDTVTSLPKISGTIEGAPSEEVDLRANDLIYEVDGVSTYGLTLTEVVSMIKGPENTDVVLTIIREGASDYLEVKVTRRQVETPTVEYSMMEDGMAYIQVTEFDEVSIDQFADALATAKGSGMKGMILDLRGNPGGSLNAVVEMARMILPEGMIVYTEDKNGKRSEYTCDGKRKMEVPLVVLVDMNSASASEIMAGAIKDYGLGTLVGTTTFGKGIVQQIIPFRDGSAVKLTISAYYTPKGNNIHGIGVEPDVVCEFDGEAYYGSEDHPDNQLEKAKEVLREMME